MNQQGFLRVITAIPKVRVADVDSNKDQILYTIIRASEGGAQLLVFPELALTGATCADLFFQTGLIQKAAQALNDLCEKTSQRELVWIVGLPYYSQGRLFNAAAVVYKGKIMALIGKKYLSASEIRWFSPCENQLLSQSETSVASGTVFSAYGVKFGVEIGNDFFAPTPPSTNMAMAGADVILNLSSNCEAVGQYERMRQLIQAHTLRLPIAYAFVSAGLGESTTNTVMGGQSLICEHDEVLSESQRFCAENQILTADIDILRLRALRLRKARCAAQDCPCVSIPTGIIGDSELLRVFDCLPFIPIEDKGFEEVYNILIQGLTKRFVASHSAKLVIGISGGLDSTLALLVSVGAFKQLDISPENIVAVTMPGFGTTDRTYQNAIRLIELVGASLREVSIRKACEQHFADIGLDINERGAAYENAQARERTQILMDIANMENGLVVGTGDMSELALGWATYNGDHMSMYGVNAGVPKTLVREMVAWYAKKEVNDAAEEDRDTTDSYHLMQTLMDVVNTPISPELLPAKAGKIEQKTEDLVGPYELHDFFLFYFLSFGFSPSRIFYMAQIAFANKFDAATIKKWLVVFVRRFFSQQFKRSALPDGPSVFGISLSPRGDWQMPSDAQADLWIAEAENLIV